jgi:hypothetical protein
MKNCTQCVYFRDVSNNYSFWCDELETEIHIEGFKDPKKIIDWIKILGIRCDKQEVKPDD